MADNRLEVTKDIVVALISRTNGYIGKGEHEELAKQVAAVFEIVYDKVNAKYNGK